MMSDSVSTTDVSYVDIVNHQYAFEHQHTTNSTQPTTGWRSPSCPSNQAMLCQPDKSGKLPDKTLSTPHNASQECIIPGDSVHV
jgi:hypothetical protein